MFLQVSKQYKAETENSLADVGKENEYRSRLDSIFYSYHLGMINRTPSTVTSAPAAASERESATLFKTVKALELKPKLFKTRGITTAKHFENPYENYTLPKP